MARFFHGLKRVVATGCYTGYLPFAPGTFGTLLGVGIYFLLSPTPWLYYPCLVLFMAGGWYSAEYYEREIARESNPRSVVIDEVVGYMVAMISFPFIAASPLSSIKYMLLGFLIFRIFDIWKPYPVSYFGDLSGAKGIMLGDVMAGIYTNLFLQFIRWEPYAKLPGLGQ